MRKYISIFSMLNVIVRPQIHALRELEVPEPFLLRRASKLDRGESRKCP
jgi:hypothetical protein